MAFVLSLKDVFVSYLESWILEIFAAKSQIFQQGLSMSHLPFTTPYTQGGREGGAQHG